MKRLLHTKHKNKNNKKQIKVGGIVIKISQLMRSLQDVYTCNHFSAPLAIRDKLIALNPLTDTSSFFLFTKNKISTISNFFL